MPKRPAWKPTPVAPVAAAAKPADAAFARKPTVERAGETVKISFVVAAPTDVAVGIVDGSGRFVRHLATGALGKNAPPPLKPDSLDQSLAWDGKDDSGQAVPAGDYKARVSLGIRPQFDFIFKDAAGADIDVGQSLVAKAVGLGTLEPANWNFHPHGGFLMQLCANPASEQVVLRGKIAFDGATGKPLGDVKLAGLPGFPSAKASGELGIDRQGNYWVTANNEMRRFAPDGSPLPFAALAGPVLPQVMLGHANPNRGFCFGGPDGDCYVVHHEDWRWNWTGVVTQIAQNGRVRQWGLVYCRYPIACVKADRAGNVYVACTARPKDRLVPADIPHADQDETKAFYGPLYGSVVKFAPPGGAVQQAKDGDLVATANTYGFDKKPRLFPCKITGAQWIRPDFSVITCRSGPCHCNCATGRFDLDPFERLWIPDAIRSRIDIVDANGNTLATVGKFGSPADSKAGDIRLAYPKMVAATDGGCYVMDFSAGRAVKLKIAYSAEAEAKIGR